MILRKFLSPRLCGSIRWNATFPGLMQSTPLLISSLLEFAGKYHGDTEVVSRSVEGPIHRYTYSEALERSKRLARALGRLGVGPGDRVGTLAWNGYRHLELYYSVSGSGSVLHTINPRLFPEQSVRTVVVMTDREHMPKDQLKDALCYEDLLDAETPEYQWPNLDENTAASMCYTSGTTGNPKGVVYSHRSTVLHSWGIVSADSLAISSRDSVMPVVPKFHACGWGLPYACPMVGAKLVLPGAQLDGKSLHELLNAEKVTLAAGVPTIWMMLLQHMEKTGTTLPFLDRTLIGGSAVPPSMIRDFEVKHNVRVLHAYGMTELSPLASVCNLKKKHDTLSKEEQFKIQHKQGRAVYGCELRIVDDKGEVLPNDGKTAGRLQVRGPWVLSQYHGAGKPATDEQGWFDTGDISTLDADGYMQITDRAKDVIKVGDPLILTVNTYSFFSQSGGEWISSIDLENAAMGHPGVAEAAAIGLPHPKWDERPLLLVIKKSPDLTKESVREYLSQHVAKWWLPDDIVFVESLPHTATGKLSKLEIRKKFEGYVLPTVH